MITLLMLLGLLNGNFSDGLNHWQADTGWSAQRGAAVLRVDNRAGNGTRGANLCSERVNVPDVKTLRGGANVKQSAGGYVFIGVRWYDRRGNVLWTEMLASGEGREGQDVRLTFSTNRPRSAASAAFCFFSGAYAGSEFRARADNAELK